MNKKSTLLAAVLMAVSSLTVSAAGITPDKCEKGNYYYLLTGTDKYLSLDGLKADSVITKALGKLDETTIAHRDSALWEITKMNVSGSDAVYYQIKNKKTKAILSFDPTSKEPVLNEGANKWVITSSVFYAVYGDNEDKKLYLKNDSKGIIFQEEGGDVFSVTKTDAKVQLKAEDINPNFASFKFAFGDQFEDNIFEGKELVAVDGEEEGYVKLQVKGQDQEDEKDLFLGIDTTSLGLTGAKGAYGAVFALDSTYEKSEIHSVGNKGFQQFKFTKYLKNDSLAIEVLAAPNLTDKGTIVSNVPVVYTTFNNKKYLTVGGENQGVDVFFAVKQSTPASIAKSGVYFLKSASKEKNGGKYIKGYNQKTKEIETMEGTPSVYLAEGQWYVKAGAGLYDGMYSIVDRATDSNILMKGEVFAVKDMPNTYTLGASGDSITLEYQKDVDLNNKYLGSAYYSKEDLANKGYVLNLIPNGMDESELYVIDSESRLQIKTAEMSDAVTFKLEPVETTVVGGAKSLQDTISRVSYKLVSRFDETYVGQKAESTKFTLGEDITEFQFLSASTGDKYAMKIVDKDKYVSSDAGTSDMQESSDVVYFKLQEVEAPKYAAFETGHKRFTSDAKSLTMNTLNMFAELKVEGQEILKSTYEKDNFSLKLIKSKASTPEMPLYFITTVMTNDVAKAEVEQTRYYMVPGRDSASVAGNEDKYMFDDKYRVHFIAGDDIENMKDATKNPALFALKVTESGNYLLESYQEMNLSDEEKADAAAVPYVGISNNVVVMSNKGIEFSLADAPSPVANESIEAPTTIKVIGGNGEFQIRNAGGKKVILSNILGQTIGSRFISSDNESVQTARGVVIVSVEGDKAYKVIVK